MSIGKPLGIIVITNWRIQPRKRCTGHESNEFSCFKTILGKIPDQSPEDDLLCKNSFKGKLLDEGSLIEIKVTNSSGKTMAANIRVKKEDIEFLGGLKNVLEK